jgi:hypothetical protein
MGAWNARFGGFSISRSNTMHDTMTGRAITICTIVPLLVTGTGSSITTTVTSSHACNGKEQIGQTALTNAVTPVLDFNTGLAFPALVGTATAGQGTVVVYGYLEGGADGIASVKCMMGSIETLDTAGAFTRPPQFPLIPNNVTPFAYQVLKQFASATSVTFGTSAWAATGYTNAIVRCKQLPLQPQVA